MFLLLNRDGQENLFYLHLDRIHLLLVLPLDIHALHILQAYLVERIVFSVVVNPQQERLAMPAAAVVVLAGKLLASLDVVVRLIIVKHSLHVPVAKLVHHFRWVALVTDSLLLSIKKNGY